MRVPIVLALLLTTGCSENRAGNEGHQQRYQLGVDANGNAWVLDTQNRDVLRCWQGNPVNEKPTCYMARQLQAPN